MEWYWAVIIAIGAVLAVACVRYVFRRSSHRGCAFKHLKHIAYYLRFSSLHAFEHFYRKRVQRDSELGISNFTFNLGSSVNLSEDAPRSRAYAAATEGSYASTPASPASMTFSDASSPSSTTMEFPQTSVTHLPRKPAAALHVKPQKTFISFDHLRGTSNEPDLEAHNTVMGGAMKDFGW